MSENILYFAYGSNLNQEDLNRWKVKKTKWKNTDLSMQKVSVGYLEGYRLGFTRTAPSRENMGVADIVPSGDPLSRVWGVIFALTEEQGKAIEAKEGFVGVGDLRNSYEQIKVEVTDMQGAKRACLTYQAIVQGKSPREKTFFLPHPGYIKVIYLGGEQHQLPKEFFEHLKAKSRGDLNACH